LFHLLKRGVHPFLPKDRRMQCEMEMLSPNQFDAPPAKCHYLIRN
jgi:hypothetical protein